MGLEKIGVYCPTSWMLLRLQCLSAEIAVMVLSRDLGPIVLGSIHAKNLQSNYQMKDNRSNNLA